MKDYKVFDPKLTLQENEELNYYLTRDEDEKSPDNLSATGANPMVAPTGLMNFDQ